MPHRDVYSAAAAVRKQFHISRSYMYVKFREPNMFFVIRIIISRSNHFLYSMQCIFDTQYYNIS